MNTQPNLICEVNSYITASKDEVARSREKHDGYIVLKTLMQRAEKVNQMHRMYPKDLLLREFKTYQKFVDDQSAHGELDHRTASSVALANTSHIVTSQTFEDDNGWYGEIKLLNTPSGKIAQSLVEDGVKIGISSRGIGGLQKLSDGTSVIQPNFTIICFDLVSQPSTHDAHPYISESIDIASMSKDLQQRYLENCISTLVNQDWRGRYNKS